MNEWRGRPVCRQCFRMDRNIQNDIRLGFSILNGYMLFGNSTLYCELCNIKVYTEGDAVRHNKFELDHIDPQTKLDAVSSMIFKGDRINMVLAEADKCRVLCVSCHTIVTHIQRQYNFCKLMRDPRVSHEKKSKLRQYIKCIEKNVRFDIIGA